ncbi:SDR family oxidoreductase [Nocardioides sp. zg-536]|uniref:SDR family oxidoreductase n=1 Tax=Nocardioides faecalis TaxID=2803858 RepID=A0A938Y8I5_9ACTN|nr:SDR family oxidoreductase [Nocardioides faecalis]MBM9459441.1 SDR family oxidoreductase [Nocardioides faecalis]QVI59452.1 SDR family oxidoreductase [Nocardioides faecalis]
MLHPTPENESRRSPEHAPEETGAQVGAERPLAGRVAVVTGASSGLGLAFARLLGRAGAQVMVAALPGSGVDDAVGSLRADGLQAHGHELDVADLPAVEALAARARDLGPLGVWVNNAGAPGVYGPAHLVPSAVFERVLDANVRGVFHGTRTAVAAMLAEASTDPTRAVGHVVNVWGKGATKPVPMQSAYASSKAWNRAFTRTVRAELAGTGVRVHGFDPGLVRTEMLSRVTVAPGMERRVRALPYVAALWGQSPEDAAAPLLPLLLEGRDDHRDLTLGTVLGRGVRSVARGELRSSRRMKLDVRVLED